MFGATVYCIAERAIFINLMMNSTNAVHHIRCRLVKTYDQAMFFQEMRVPAVHHQAIARRAAAQEAVRESSYYSFILSHVFNLER